MAKYQAKAKLFVDNRLIQPGDTFESDLPPGQQWEPMDDAARSAVASRPSSPRTTRPRDGARPAATPEEKKAAIRAQMSALQAQLDGIEGDKSDAVEIPDGWEKLKPEQRINLARRLGAPVKGTGAAKADEVIQAEVDKRAAASEEA